jgi:hypothetical protein
MEPRPFRGAGIRVPRRLPNHRTLSGRDSKMSPRKPKGQRPRRLSGASVRQDAASLPLPSRGVRLSPRAGRRRARSGSPRRTVGARPVCSGSSPHGRRSRGTHRRSGRAGGCKHNRGLAMTPARRPRLFFLGSPWFSSRSYGNLRSDRSHGPAFCPRRAIRASSRRQWQRPGSPSAETIPVVRMIARSSSLSALYGVGCRSS